MYASVANHGKFAQHPWAGLFADAYTNPTEPAPQKSQGNAAGNNSGSQANQPSHPSQSTVNTVNAAKNRWLRNQHSNPAPNPGLGG